MSDGYHHGNLRQALIDAGVRIINESGEEGLSLRKVAASCGVTHAAPYAHFKDKDELINAIKASVNEQFMEELRQAAAGGQDAEKALINMGRSYVSFFARNPDYFRFLFGNQNIVAHLQPDKRYEEDYPPFALLKDTYRKYLKEKNIKKNKEKQELELIHLWSSAHGLAAIACMPGVETSFDWQSKKIWEVLLR